MIHEINPIDRFDFTRIGEATASFRGERFATASKPAVMMCGASRACARVVGNMVPFTACILKVRIATLSVHIADIFITAGTAKSRYCWLERLL